MTESENSQNQPTLREDEDFEFAQVFLPLAKEIKEAIKPGKTPSDEQIALIISQAFQPPPAGAPPNGHTVSVMRTESMSFSGPTPSPQVLEAYERIFPGCSKRFFDRIDEEQAHRHDIERGYLENDRKTSFRRDLMTFSISLMGFSTVGGLLYAEQFLVGAILTGFLVLGGGALWLGSKFIGKANGDGVTAELNSSEKQK